MEQYQRRLKAKESSNPKRHSDANKRRPLQPVTDNMRNITNGQKRDVVEGLKPKRSLGTASRICRALQVENLPKETEEQEADTYERKLKRDSSEFASNLQNLRPKKRARTYLVSSRSLVTSLQQKLCTILGKQPNQQVDGLEDQAVNFLDVQESDAANLMDVPAAGANAFRAVQTTTDIGNPNHIWIMKWVDYSQKYGLGYVLSNHITGVSFNDRTKIVSNPTREYVG